MRHEFCTNGYQNQKRSINRITMRVRHEPKMAEATRTVKEGQRGRAGRDERDIEKRSCDQESQLPTLAQVHPVEHIFPT